jgi:chromosomal replication initiator protein
MPTPKLAERPSNDAASAAQTGGRTPTPAKGRPALDAASIPTATIGAAPVRGEAAIAAVSAKLVAAIGQHRFDLWFGHGAEMRVEAKSLRIVAPTSYVVEWIERHYRATLDAAVAEIFGAGASWTISIASSELDADGSAESSTAPSPARLRGEGRESGREQSTPGRRGSDDAHAPASVPALGTDDARRRAAQNDRAGRISTFRRLEDFVVGDSNRLAFAASAQVGDGTPDAPGILFIHGECGVGKTHLIQGLCRRRLERAPRQVIRYVTAEQFTNEYIAAVRDGSLDAFRKRLRRVDLLAIDDIHFLANKTATQGEFLHTIDAIDLSGARVALVSDEHPRHIRRFSQALVSRFLSGMVVRVERPDRSTRVELVRRRARERGLDLTSAAEDAIAGRCAGSIREIEGAITRLGALVELDGLRGQIGPGTVERLLGGEQAIAGASAPIRLGSIVEAVCEKLRVPREDLLGSGRHARTVVARGLVAHLARELTTHSYPEIARALGRDTHSAVHTAAKRLGQMVTDDARVSSGGEPVREVVDQLRHDLARQARAKSG